MARFHRAALPALAALLLMFAFACTQGPRATNPTKDTLSRNEYVLMDRSEIREDHSYKSKVIAVFKKGSSVLLEMRSDDGKWGRVRAANYGEGTFVGWVPMNRLRKQ